MRNAAFFTLAAVAVLLAAGPVAYLVVGGVGGYAAVLRDEPIGRWLANTVWIAGCQTLLAAGLASSAGFALAAYRFRGRSLVIGLLVATLLLPGPTAVIGLFEVVAVAGGGLDSFWAVILPGSFGVFGVFLYAATFRSLPASRLEAARLDGATEPRILWSIALPAARPTTAAFVLLHFLSAWNALLWPAAVLVTEDKQPFAVALATLARRADYEADPSRLLAATAVAVVPVFALFLVCGRSFLRGEEVE